VNSPWNLACSSKGDTDGQSPLLNVFNAMPTPIALSFLSCLQVVELKRFAPRQDMLLFVKWFHCVEDSIQRDNLTMFKALTPLPCRSLHLAAIRWICSLVRPKLMIWVIRKTFLWKWLLKNETSVLHLLGQTKARVVLWLHSNQSRPRLCWQVEKNGWSAHVCFGQKGLTMSLFAL